VEVVMRHVGRLQVHVRLTPVVFRQD
jgi:hypothetical protein